MAYRGVLWLSFWHYLGTKVFVGFTNAEPTSLDGCLGVVAGEAWTPAMPGTGITTEVSWRVCQTRCGVTPACARFTFLQNGSCSLHGSKASLRAEVLAISGPSACGGLVDMQQSVAAADVMPVPRVAAFVSPPQVTAAPLQMPGLLISPATTKQLLGSHSTVASVVPPPNPLPQQVGDEQVSSDGVFLSWKALSALLLLACLLCAGLAFCALWLYAKERSEDADDVPEKGKRLRDTDFHLEEEVIYPTQTQIRWYPNLERHPSFVEDLLPKGLRASVDTELTSAATSQASSNTFGAGTQHVGSVQSSTRSDRSHRSLTLSWHCRVGDSVEVFSKGAGKWIRCQVISIHGSRMTVAHGNNTRRIDLRDRDLHSYFRLKTHNIVT